jgi:hypothetical protein
MSAGGAVRVRLAELVSTLSLATDLGMGQPLEQALRTCLLAVAAGRELGLDDAVRCDTYYLALLRFVGCTADAHEQAALVGGDDIAFYAGVAPVVMGDMSEFFTFVMRRFATDAPPLRRARIVGRVLADGERGAKRSIAIHCEVARMLAARMGLPETVADSAAHAFERWDGKGLPGELSGEAIPAPARIVATARDVDLFSRLGGWDAVVDVLRRRRAKAHDPAVVDVFLARGERWLAERAPRSGRKHSPPSRPLGGTSAMPGWTTCLAPSPPSRTSSRPSPAATRRPCPRWPRRRRATPG